MDLYTHYLDTRFPTDQITAQTSIPGLIAKNEFTNIHAMSQDQVDKKDFNFVRIQEVNERIDEIRKEKQR